MKICMITGTLPPVKCGVGDYTNILCNNLMKYDSQIDLNVITTEGLNNKIYKTYDIIKNWDMYELKKIIHYIDKINPDIVHIQYPTLAYKRNWMINFLPYFLKKRYKIVITIHEYSDNSILGKIRIWPNILFSDYIVVVDKQYANDIKKIKILSKKNIKYINISSNIPKSSISIQQRNEIRKSILKDECNKILGYFGFINKTKGIETILYSMDKLNKEDNLRTKFVIIGELNKENEYHNSIIQLIHKLELEKYIYVTGYLDEMKVANYINATDYMVLPFVNGVSTKNGSFLTAMQEGKYIITTKRNNEEVFKDENIFYMKKYNDFEGLAKLVKDKQNNEMSNLNINKESSFTWKNTSKKHIAIYKSLLV